MNFDKKITIGFIIFYPELVFIQRLEWLATAGYNIYIFDNSPESVGVKKITLLHDNMYYATAGQNVGLGTALSIITASAFYDANQMMLFFDQDTSFTLETIEYINTFKNTHSNLILEKYAVIAFDSKQDSNKMSNQIEQALLVISSGSLFVLNNLKCIGWHNYSYFVDGVDYELCLRARSKGYLVGRFSDTPGFDHVSEQPDSYITLLGKRLPLRQYSMVRLKDSFKAYLRLIWFTVIKLDFKAFLTISRSFIIFITGQIMSVLLLKKVK